MANVKVVGNAALDLKRKIWAAICYNPEEIAQVAGLERKIWAGMVYNPEEVARVAGLRAADMVGMAPWEMNVRIAAAAWASAHLATVRAAEAKAALKTEADLFGHAGSEAEAEVPGTFREMGAPKRTRVRKAA